MAVELKDQKSRDLLRDLVVDGFQQMKDERAELEARWIRCLLSYLCTFDKAWASYAKQAGRSCRYVALNFDAVETITPQIYESIFGPEEWLKLFAQRPGFNEDDDLWAEAIKLMLKMQLQQSKYRPTARLGIKQLVMLGNCPWSMAWTVKRAPNYKAMAEATAQWVQEVAERQREIDEIRQEYQSIVVQSQLSGVPPPPEPKFTQVPEPPRDLDIVFQGPVLQIGDIFNYVQEQHPNDDEQALRIIRTWRTKAHLRDLAKKDETGWAAYENLDMIVDTESEERARQNDAEILMKMALGMNMPTKKDKTELKEQHGTFELPSGPEAGVYRGYVVTVANDNTVVRCEKSPLYSGRPMLQNARLITMRGAVYGIGAIEKAMDDQDSGNALHNQNIDAVNSVIQPEYEVVIDNLAGPMQPSGPGAKHPVIEKGTYNAITKNYTGLNVGQAAVDQVIARHERITGAVNTAPGRTETATRTARNSGIINTKLGSHVTATEDSLITESINMAIEMNAQLIDDIVTVPVLQDEKFIGKITIPPEVIRRGWIARAAGSKYIAEKQQRIDSMMMELQIVSQTEASGRPVPIDTYELHRILAKEILEDVGSSVMKSKQQFEAEIQQYQQMQAQMQQAQLMATAPPQGEATDGQPSGPPADGAAGPA